MDLKIGELFNDQIEHNDNPHAYEGLVYAGVSCTYMFCQVDYAKFAFINLDEGNRSSVGVQLSVPIHPELGGYSGRAVLRTMDTELCEDVKCCGKLDEWLGGLHD